ncbi:MAG: MlaE family lipid ABC transporter permease subunit, partial [Pseudomonadota bacterium]
KNVVVDLQEVEYLDSAGAAVLMEARARCKEMNNTLETANAAGPTHKLLELAGFDKTGPAAVIRPRSSPNLLTQVGDGTIGFLETARTMITFVGNTAAAMARDIRHPKRARWDNVWRLMEKSGSDAVPIVVLLSFLQGAILAFQAAIQLRKFGATLFVADLVSVAICLEMGPLITALIVTGRSGAAFAAEIGTMQVTEEVDALRLMAVDPISYLVLPRIFAVGFVLPCLTLFADAAGIIGGCVVGALSLDLTPITYFNQAQRVLEVSDVIKGLIKSFVFGIEAASIGCFCGFQVKGGAEKVGKATTAAVVMCVFVLTVTDAVFAMLFHYLRLL